MSGEVKGEKVDPGAITAGDQVASGVRAGPELIAFAEAAVLDSPELPAARAAVANALGEDALIDAAAVVGNFQRMVRITDGTGIPLDGPIAMMSEGIRDELGINSYRSAKNTPELGILKRSLGRILQPFAPRLMKRFRGPAARPSD